MLPRKTWRQRGCREGPEPVPALGAPGQPHRTPLVWHGEGGGADAHLFIPVLGPVHTIVAEGHPVGCHVLDVAEVSGTLGDNASHLLLGAQVNL